MRVPRLIFVFVFCQLGVRIHAALPTCNIFGNNLVQATAASIQVNGLYMKIANAASCPGNVTRWNMCFYSANSDTMITSYFAVYRPTNGSNYRRIGSAATYDATRNMAVAYVCDHIPIPRSEQYVVLPQDVLAVCLRNSRYQAMVASNVPGASVLKDTPLCKSISAMTDTLDVTGYNTITRTTLHVSIDVNECAVNNGGCGQICNDTTPGYSCSCYSGYQLLLDGMNCSNISTSTFQVSTAATTPKGISTSTFKVSSTTATPEGISISTFKVSSTTTTPEDISTSTFATTTTEDISTSTFKVPSQSATTTPEVTAAHVTNLSASEAQVPGSAVASVIVIVVVAAMVAAAVIIIIVIWKRKYAGKFIPVTAQGLAMDNVVYTGRTSTVTLMNNKADASAIYEPVKDDEDRNTCYTQATYEDPEISGVKYYHDKLSQPNTSEDPRSVVDEYTLIDQQICEQGHEVEKEYEDPYYMPASCEKDLYVQLENYKIKKVSRSTVSVTKMLGSGQFGGVQMGIWNGSKGRCEVAIKTLNPTITQPDAKVKFLQEAAIMAQFRHPNVIQLYGIVTDGAPVMLVIELAHKGDLRTHLDSLKPDPGQLVHQDLYLQLLAYSKQIADGMKYLSSKSFVHRDIAARNILVTQNCMCKIADFGLSRDLADDTYYVSHGGMVPIKWTAPEAIHFKKYSTASDVWSYGCLLYEIWSMGVKPFEGKTNADVVQKVDSGYRLPSPPGCPQLIYQLMIQCWNPDTYSRPAFRDIYLSLHQSTEFVLQVPDDARLTHPQAGILGAPLDAGEKMYIDLQKSYI
eukprot:Em0008g879a